MVTSFIIDSKCKIYEESKKKKILPKKREYITEIVKLNFQSKIVTVHSTKKLPILFLKLNLIYYLSNDV